MSRPRPSDGKSGTPRGQGARCQRNCFHWPEPLASNTRQSGNSCCTSARSTAAVGWTPDTRRSRRSRRKRGKEFNLPNVFIELPGLCCFIFVPLQMFLMSGWYFSVCVHACVRAVGLLPRPRTSLCNVVSLCCFLSRVFVQLHHLFLIVFIRRSVNAAHLWSSCPFAVTFLWSFHSRL